MTAETSKPSSGPLFSELGFSKELYEIRQKNGRNLLIAAWLIEIVAALIGLLIVAILFAQGIDDSDPIDTSQNIKNSFSDLPTSVKLSIAIGALPFFMCSVVELMKIPIVTLVYHSKSLLWKGFFAIALAALAFITFETLAAGMQQGYQVRTMEIQNLSQQITQKRERLASAKSDLENRENIDGVEFSSQREQLNSKRTEERQKTLEEHQKQADEYSQRFGKGVVETANANYQAKLQERTQEKESLDNRLEQSAASFTRNRVQAEANYQTQLEANNQRYARIQEGYIKESSDCSGIRQRSCKRDAVELREKNQADTNTERKGIESSFEEAIKRLENEERKERENIRKEGQERIAALSTDTQEAENRLNRARSEDDQSLRAISQELEREKNDRLEFIEREYIQALEALDRREQIITAPANDSVAINDLRAEIQTLGAEISEQSEQLDDSSRRNQIYQIAKLARSACLFVSNNDECVSVEGSSNMRYSSLPQEYVEKISMIWFGSLAAIISTTGILLAFGAMVLKYEHIDEHRGIRLWLRSVGSWIGIFFSYLLKALVAVRRYFIEKRKRAMREPVIVEKEIEIIKEIPVDKIVTKEVIKEVPIEKVVVKHVEKPVSVVEKEFVYIPFYTDDPEERKKFQQNSPPPKGKK